MRVYYRRRLSTYINRPYRVKALPFLSTIYAYRSFLQFPRPLNLYLFTFTFAFLVLYQLLKTSYSKMKHTFN